MKRAGGGFDYQYSAQTPSPDKVLYAREGMLHQRQEAMLAMIAMRSWEDTLDVDRLAAGKSDKSLCFGTSLVMFKHDGQIYTAKVAMTFGLLLRLRGRDYPGENAEDGIEGLLMSGNSDGYLFVHSPDQVMVVYSPRIRWDDTPK